VENGYLSVEKDGPEIFIRRQGTSGVLCVRTDSGLQHAQTEVALSPEQLAVLWPLSEGRRACKVSHQLQLDNIPVTLDLYQGRLNWLRIAEAVFKGRGAAEAFEVPPWMYREITDIAAYRNSNLSRE
jgi:CYTH domain-containing protein